MGNADRLGSGRLCLLPLRLLLLPLPLPAAAAALLVPRQCERPDCPNPTTIQPRAARAARLPAATLTTFWWGSGSRRASLRCGVVWCALRMEKYDCRAPSGGLPASRLASSLACLAGTPHLLPLLPSLLQGIAYVPENDTFLLLHEVRGCGQVGGPTSGSMSRSLPPLWTVHGGRPPALARPPGPACAPSPALPPT